MPSIDALIAIAIKFWLSFGLISFPSIVATHVPGRDHMASTSWPIENDTCQITLYDPFYEADGFLQQIAITHEVGHCIGLDHIAVINGIMSPTISDATKITAENGREFERIYFLHHVVVPMIGTGQSFN